MGFDFEVAGLRTSVIIPVRDGQAHVADAIDSVLSQLADTDEIVVVDDASTDKTKSVVNARLDSRIRLVEGTGRGASSARNIGLAAAHGEFVAFLDHDDVWPPGRHAVLRRALIDHPDIDAAHGRQRIRVEAGAQDRAWMAAKDNRHLPFNIMFTALFRRWILDKVGGFAEDLRLFEDIDCCARMTEAGMRVVACDVDSLIYRHHGGNSTRDRAVLADAAMEYLQRRIARTRDQRRRSRP